MKDPRSAKKPKKGDAEEAAAAMPTELELPADGGIRLELPGFEGPLDLLLHLIQEHELDILNIPIAFVTAKYLEYIRLMEVLNIDVASEYLVMAATLVHIKSRMLLPTPPADDEEGEEEELDPRAELIRRLLEYQKYKKAGEELAARSVLGRDVFVRGAQPAADPTTAPLAPVSSFKLLEAFQRVLTRAKIVVDHQIEFERFSLSDRINQLVDLLKNRGRVLFEDLFDGQHNRADLIVTFLALLELTRLRMTHLFQEASLDPIFVELAVSDDEANEPALERAEVPHQVAEVERPVMPAEEGGATPGQAESLESDEEDIDDFDLDSLGLDLEDEGLEEDSEHMSPAPKGTVLDGSDGQSTDAAAPVHSAENEGEALSELSPASEAREFEESEESMAQALGSVQPSEPLQSQPSEGEEQYTPTLRPTEEGAESPVTPSMMVPHGEDEEQHTPGLRPTDEDADDIEAVPVPHAEGEERYTPTLRPTEECEEPSAVPALAVDSTDADELLPDDEGHQKLLTEQPSESAEERVPSSDKVKVDAAEAIEPCGGRLPDAEPLPSDEAVVSSADVELKLKQ